MMKSIVTKKGLIALTLISLSFSVSAFDFFSSNRSKSIEKAIIKDGIQNIKITVNERGFSPQIVVVQKGMKAVFTFVPERLTGCNSTVVFPDFDGVLYLRQNQLESPPIEMTKDTQIQCGMNMIRTKIKVVDDLEGADINKLQK